MSTSSISTLKAITIIYCPGRLSTATSPNVLSYLVRNDLNSLGISPRCCNNVEVSCVEDTVRVVGLTDNDTVRRILEDLSNGTDKTRSILGKLKIVSINLNGVSKSVIGNESRRTRASRSGSGATSSRNDNPGTRKLKPDGKAASFASYRRMSEKRRLEADDYSDGGGTSAQQCESSSKHFKHWQAHSPGISDNDSLFSEKEISQLDDRKTVEPDDITVSEMMPKSSSETRSLVRQDEPDVLIEAADSYTETVARLEKELRELRSERSTYQLTIEGLKNKITKLEEKLASTERDRLLAKKYAQNISELFS